MRIIISALMCAGALFGQGANRVQFRDWHPPAPAAKPKVTCGSLRALTNYNLSIVAATVMPASADVPEHCRVSLMIYADTVLRYMVFPEKDPASSLGGFDIDRDPQRFATLRTIMDATDRDLTAFRQRNGKLRCTTAGLIPN